MGQKKHEKYQEITAGAMAKLVWQRAINETDSAPTLWEQKHQNPDGVLCM